MAIVRVCSRCGAFHRGRGRCRACRSRGENTGTPGEPGPRERGRIRRIVLIRDGCCILCGAADELHVLTLPGVAASGDAFDYAAVCVRCAPDFEGGRAA